MMVFVSVTVAAVTLAACGGDDGGSTTPTTRRSTTTTTTPTTSAATTSTTPRNDTCLVGQLSAAITNANAGAGQREATVVFANTGSQSCTMFGYIGMQLLGTGGASIPTNVVRTPGSPTLVTVAPGAKASAALQWGAIAGSGEPTNGPCEPEPQQVQITPPNETHQLVVAWTGGPVCEQGTINTKPVQLGAG
jgi:hypothetical protein